MSNFSWSPLPAPTPAPVPATPPAAPPVGAPPSEAPASRPGAPAGLPGDATTADGLRTMRELQAGAGAQGVPAAPAGAKDALAGFAPPAGAGATGTAAAAKDPTKVAPNEQVQAAMTNVEALIPELPSTMMLDVANALDTIRNPEASPEAKAAACGALTSKLAEAAGERPALAAKCGDALGKLGKVGTALQVPAAALGFAGDVRAFITGKDAKGNEIPRDERAQLATSLPFKAAELGANVAELGVALAPIAKKIPGLPAVLEKAAGLAAKLSASQAAGVVTKLAAVGEFANVPLALAELYVGTFKQSVKELAAGIRELDDALLKRKYGASPEGLIDRYGEDMKLALDAVGGINNQKANTPEYRAKMDQIRGLNERVAKELANAPKDHQAMIYDLRERLHLQAFKIYDGPGEKMVNGLEVLDRYVKSYYGHDTKQPPLTDQEHQWLAQHLSAFRMDSAANLRTLEGLPPRR